MGTEGKKYDDAWCMQWYGFELLVVCIGKYGDIPKMPVFPPNKGQEVYGGRVMHTLDYAKLDKEAARELLKGKKVAVVGYKKSAIDLATECAQANQGIYIHIRLTMTKYIFYLFIIKLHRIVC